MRRKVANGVHARDGRHRHGRWRTHRHYRTPVLVFRRGHHFIIALTYGRESQWVQNVLADGGCQLENMGRTVRQPRVFHNAQRRVMKVVVRGMLGLLNVSDLKSLP